MNPRIKITDYPVEYKSCTPPADRPFAMPQERETLPDSGIDRLHYHNRYQLGVCLEGNGVFLIGDRIHPVSAGDTVLIEPERVHFSRSLGSDKCVFRFIYFSLDDLFSHAILNNVRVLEMRSQYIHISSGVYSESDGELHRLTAAIINEACRGGGNEYTLCALYLTELYIMSLRQGRIDDGEIEDMYTLLPAIKLIAESFDRPLSLAELAAECKLSESHFGRLFRKNLDCSPYDYMLDIRTRTGKKLLESTDLPVGKICGITGFGNSSDFYRQFVRRFGCSPSAVRK